MNQKIPSILSDNEVYDLFLLLQTFDDIKRSIIMVLAFIYPKEASACQWAELAGYSKKSKYIFKSDALETLEKDKIITISKPAKRLMLIKLNPEHELLMKFSTICQTNDKILQETFLGKILDDE